MVVYALNSRGSSDGKDISLRRCRLTGLAVSNFVTR